jgi:hypothetical protein
MSRYYSCKRGLLTSSKHIHSSVHLDGKLIASATKPSSVFAGNVDRINEVLRTAVREIQAETGQVLLVDIPDVEIVKCGIDYSLASGPHTFTPEEIADAAAAVENPNISVPRIKLGHDGPLAQITSSDEPSVGTVHNLHVSPDGQTLLGDYKGVPSWLAGILASAYPSRSIEANLDVEKNGHKYRMVITAVSLLGVVWPGCSSIEDIQALYSEEGPEGVRVIEARQGGAMPNTAVPEQIQASVTAEEVRRAFYKNVAVGDRAYWWITSQYVDPPVLIVEGSSDEYYSIGWKTNGDEVEFDDPVEVTVQYVDDSGSVAAEEAAPVAVFASRAESRSEPDQQEDDVKFTPEQMKLLRAKLGKSEEELPDDASDEQITAALAETPPEGDQPDGGDGGAGTTENPDEEEEETPPSGTSTGDAADPGQTQGGNAVSASSLQGIQAQLKAAGLVVVDEGTLQTLQAGAQAGLRLDKKERERDRDETISAAISKGKFAPARREHYEKSWEADPEGTKALIEGLAEGIVPIEAQTKPDGESWDGSDEAYPTEWLGPQAETLAAASGSNNGGRRVTVGED